MQQNLYSTSELLFSNRSFWFKSSNNTWFEEKTILDVLTNKNYVSNIAIIKEYYSEKTVIDYISNNFWKYFSRRIWQKDDFSFKGIAGALFLGKANRFKIKFNPFKFYEMHIESILSLNLNDQEITEFLKSLGNALEQNDEITSNIEGIDFKFLKLLYSCQKDNTWNDNTWKEWNNLIINDQKVLRNLLSVFIHEYLHIILNHLTTRIDDKNSYIWNLATDYAINQSCIFTKEMKRNLITKENKKFFSSLTVSALTYQYKTDLLFKNEVDSKLTILDDTYKSIKSNVNKIKEIFNDKAEFILNNLDNKSADEYYRILLENDSENNKDRNKEKGYDNHNTWNEVCEVDIDDDEETENEDSNKEKGEIKKETNKVIEDAREEDETVNNMDGEKERGKKFSKGSIHSNFDAFSMKSESRNALKNVLSSTGVDVSDMDEVYKGLNSIPGLNNFGGILLNNFKVKTHNWKSALQNILSSTSNANEYDYTMSRESRIRPDYFPGKKLDYGLECILSLDTSGSISGPDWNDFCNQIVRISKDFNNPILRVMQCHTRISYDQKLNVSKILSMKIKETGGTIMRVIFEKLKNEKNRKPVILFTDGDIDRFYAKDYNFKIIMFLSRGHSHNKKVLETLGFSVISQDEE